MPTDNASNTVQQAAALTVDPSGNAWFAVASPPVTVVLSGIPPVVVELNPLGSAIVASAVKAGMGNAASLAFDAAGNVYTAGSYMPQTPAFPATPGAFQPAPRPSVPVLAYQPAPGGGLDVFVAKWDHSLTHLLAATLLGGEQEDAASSVAVDASGNVIVGGYTDSKAFPTLLPFQESFSSNAGFVAGFDLTLSQLLFSTYLGDTSPFVANAALPDGNGNILVAGSTVIPSPSLTQGESAPGNLVIANKIKLTPAPEVQLDSVQNYASHIAWALAPGEPISALGSGFAQDAQIVVDGLALAPISASGTAITGLLPGSLNTTEAHTIQISSSGTVSNSVLVPGAIASPGIYTANGSGVGEAFIINSDHTRNSPVNPAAPGSAITIYIAGPGDFTLTHGYAVLPQPPAVFINGFYCNGIAAKVGPVHGLPGNVYQLSVFVPDVATILQGNPDLKNFTFPAQSSIQVWMGPTHAPILSQSGVFINIK